MELNDLIPLDYIPIDCKWLVRKGYLMYHKYELIPLAFIQDNIVYIVLENKLRKEVIKLVKHIVKLGYEFYFTTPVGYSYSPSKVIEHYLWSYVQKEFYKKFNDIGFDLIKNMVDWSVKFGHYELIKESYYKILKKVNYKSYDWYSSKPLYEYDDKIREMYNSLYREIQINQII